ncbi:MAG: CPBP family intramembrane glutamic endopeptidase [Bacteroidota bacterium]
MLRTTLLPNQSPWLRLVLLLSLVTLGAFWGQLLGIRIAYASAEKLAITDVTLFTRRPLLIIQAVTASCAFIIAPLFYLRFFASQAEKLLFTWRRSYASPLLLTLGLALAFIVVNTWFIQWNIAVKLPPWLRTFEAWVQEQEATQKRLTNLLTTFHSLTDLGVGILVIGMIPAVGEELLFRGIIQKLCHQITHNIHGAIAVSALAFSAIHLQFYDFVPRFLLGALFGYIYWWTKDLLFPIAAHFFNNVLTLLLLFLYQRGIIQQDITTPAVPSKPVLLLFIVLVVVLSHYLKQLSKKSHS